MTTHRTPLRRDAARRIRFSTFAIALGLALGLLATACNDEPEPEPPVAREPRPIEPIPAAGDSSPLVGDFRSGMTLEEALAALEGSPELELIPAVSSEARGRCPGYVTQEIHVPLFHHLDEEGSLVLRLLDGQLYGTFFQPRDWVAYRAKSEELGIPVEALSRTKIAPRTRVWRGAVYPLTINYKDRGYERALLTRDKACAYQDAQEAMAAEQP